MSIVPTVCFSLKLTQLWLNSINVSGYVEIPFSLLLSSKVPVDCRQLLQVSTSTNYQSRVRVNSPDLAPTKTPQRQLIMAAEEPRQRKDPAVSGSGNSNENSKQNRRRTAENLAPPFFALLFALFALYLLFSPPSSSLSPPVPVCPSISTSSSVSSSQVIPDKNIAKMSSSEQT